MPTERKQDNSLEAAESVLVRPIGGQIYLVEEGDEERAPWEEPSAAQRSPLSGLINRH